MCTKNIFQLSGNPVLHIYIPALFRDENTISVLDTCGNSNVSVLDFPQRSKPRGDWDRKDIITLLIKRRFS